MPDASVIIAAWNAEATVAAAIVSALRQTSVTLEVIIADDASTDATADIAAGVSDPRVRVIRSPKNGGPAAARNAALEAARGVWIAVLDADDTMLPGRLETLIGKASNHALDIVADNMWVNPIGGPRRLFIPESIDATLERITFRAFCLTNRLFEKTPGYGYLKPVFRSSFLRAAGLRYDEGLRVGEDFNLVAEALASGARYGRIRDAFYNYTAAPGSISHRLGAADARAMLAADDRFLDRHGPELTPADRAAMRAHRTSVSNGAAFIAVVEAIKCRNAAEAIKQAARHPAALRHFNMPVKARLNRVKRHALSHFTGRDLTVDLTPPVRAWSARR